MHKGLSTLQKKYNIWVLNKIEIYAQKYFN